MLFPHPLMRLFGLFGLLAALNAQSSVVAKETQDEDSTQFVRVAEDSNEEPIAMETAINRHTNSDGSVIVDLVSAVHVADPKYYDELNRRFAKYDAVLYELVAPKGTRVPRGGVQPTSAVSLLQNGMTEMLKLEFQLEGIDYTVGNMVHADISPDEFSKSMQDRGESIASVFFRAMGQAMAQQANPTKQSADAQLLVALMAKNRDYELKRVLARQFENMESTLRIFEGPNGSTLVTVRNQRAVDVLKQQIKFGKNVSRSSTAPRIWPTWVSVSKISSDSSCSDSSGLRLGTFAEGLSTPEIESSCSFSKRTFLATLNRTYCSPNS